MLLALDDLHWADGASLELVAQLLRRRPAGAVMVAATYRAGQADRALVSAIERGLGEEDRRIDLGPLERTQAQALVDEADAARFDRLYDASGGNPFYLLELARLRGGADEHARPDIDALGVPAAVAAATVEELEGLSPEGRGLADGAAVAGDPFELDLAAAAAGMTEGDALDALDQLMARDIVRSTHVPRRFRFRHPLVRRAVYESCPAGARITAHRRSADALEARSAPVAARAHHVAQSAQHGDVQAVALLSEAGNAAARRAPVSAARWFSAALELLPASAPPAERMGLLTALAGSQAATGRFEESRAALTESIELTSGEDTTVRVPLICACAGVEQLLGHHEAARERLTAALAAVPNPSSPEAVDLMIHLAAGDFYRIDYEGMREWGERALAVAEQLEQPLAAACLSVLAVAVAFTGPVAEAEAYRSTAAALVDTLPDHVLEGRLDALTNLSAADLYLHRYDDAESHARRGLAIARAAGQGELGFFLIPVVATVLHTTGRVSEARELLDEAVEMSRLSGNVEALGWNLLSRAYVAVAAGDLELAQQAAAESVEVTGDLDDRLVSTYARWALASALLEAGDAARATDLLLRSRRRRRAAAASRSRGGLTSSSCSRVAGLRSTGRSRPSGAPPAPRPSPRGSGSRPRWPWRTVPPPRSRSPRETRGSQPRVPWRPPPWRRSPAPGWTPAEPGRSPAGRSPPAGSATGRWRSWSARPASSRHARRSATTPRRSTSCGSWAGGSAAAPARMTRTPTAWTPSLRASSTWPGWWWTAVPIRR